MVYKEKGGRVTTARAQARGNTKVSRLAVSKARIHPVHGATVSDDNRVWNVDVWAPRPCLHRVASVNRGDCDPAARPEATRSLLTAHYSYALQTWHRPVLYGERSCGLGGRDCFCFLQKDAPDGVGAHK